MPRVWTRPNLFHLVKSSLFITTCNDPKNKSFGNNVNVGKGEKKKLVTSIFSFPKMFSAIPKILFINNHFVVCKCIQFGPV